MSKYLLTIRIPIEAVDDVSARLEATALICNQKRIKEIPGADCKLQQINDKTPPRSVTISSAK